MNEWRKFSSDQEVLLFVVCFLMFYMCFVIFHFYIYFCAKSTVQLRTFHLQMCKHAQGFNILHCAIQSLRVCGEKKNGVLLWTGAAAVSCIWVHKVYFRNMRRNPSLWISQLWGLLTSTQTRDLNSVRKYTSSIEVSFSSDSNSVVLRIQNRKKYKAREEKWWREHWLHIGMRI
jgi:hypothetical protein